MSTAEAHACRAEPIAGETCRFCNSEASVLCRVCAKCRRELERWAHDRYGGSGIEVPPHEIEPITEKGIERWRQWFKTIDGGGGTPGPGRQSAIDRICDAALVGMKIVKKEKKLYHATIARTLRELAEKVERESR